MYELGPLIGIDLDTIAMVAFKIVDAPYMYVFLISRHAETDSYQYMMCIIK